MLNTNRLSFYNWLYSNVHWNYNVYSNMKTSNYMKIRFKALIYFELQHTSNLNFELKPFRIRPQLNSLWIGGPFNMNVTSSPSNIAPTTSSSVTVRHGYCSIAVHTQGQWVSRDGLYFISRTWYASLRLSVEKSAVNISWWYVSIILSWTTY